MVKLRHLFVDDTNNKVHDVFGAVAEATTAIRRCINPLTRKFKELRFLCGVCFPCLQIDAIKNADKSRSHRPDVPLCRLTYVLHTRADLE